MAVLQRGDEHGGVSLIDAFLLPPDWKTCLHALSAIFDLSAIGFDSDFAAPLVALIFIEDKILEHPSSPPDGIVAEDTGPFGHIS